MPLSLLRDSTGMHSEHNNRKPRLFLEYVDLEKTYPLLKAGGQLSLQRGKRAMVNSQEENHNHLKMEEELLTRKRDIVLLPSESQLAFKATPPYRQDITQKPVYANPPSLPPSSPLAFSSEGNDAVGLLEEGDVEADPFGFLAAEKKLKNQKPRFPSIIPYPESLSEEFGSFGEEDIPGKAFASQTSLTLKKHPVLRASVEQKRIVSPSASLLTNCSNDASSPCRKAVRRRSTTRRKAIRGVEKRTDEEYINEPSQSKVTALDEAFPPKHSKRNGRTKRKGRGTSKKRALRRHLTKTGNTRTEILSHLNDEERKKFEKEREERMAYYRQLDTYCVAKENVWVV